MALDLDKIRSHVEASAPHAAPAELPAVEYAADPVRFAREWLEYEPWSRQAEILTAAATHARVAVRSGHKVGKSLTAATIALWWVSTRPNARVVLVAPTARQVRGILWKEIRRLHRRGVQRIGGELFDVPDKGLQFADGREIFACATDQPERISGFSGPAMMFIVDEASGVSEELFEAISGNLAGGGKLILLGNPTRTSGTFFECWGRKASFYYTLNVSSLETPNATGEPPIPGLATAEWCREMALEWGAVSPLYQARILGEFPSQVENCICGLELVEAGVARWRELNRLGAAELAELGPLEFGLDPARFGADASCLVARRGPFVYPPRVFRNLDGIQLAAKVIEVATLMRRTGEHPIIRIDIIGIGASVYDQLHMNSSVKTIAINVSESPTNPTFARRRDEAFFGVRDFLKDGGAIPDDPKLLAELVAPTYSFDVRGKIKVESKDDLRARLGRSPDRGDALALAVYAPRGGFEAYMAGLKRLGDPETFIRAVRCVNGSPPIALVIQK